MTLYFRVHSTIGSTPHSRPLNSLGHCMTICTTMMTNIRSDRDSNLVGYLHFFLATAEPNEPAHDPHVMRWVFQIFSVLEVKRSKLGTSELVPLKCGIFGTWIPGTSKLGNSLLAVADPECARGEGVSHILAEKRGVSFTLFQRNAWKCNIFTKKYALCWIRHWLEELGVLEIRFRKPQPFFYM